MFLWRIVQNYPLIITKYSPYLFQLMSGKKIFVFEQFFIYSNIQKLLWSS